MYLAQPGWTKARMIKLIRQHVPTEGCVDVPSKNCLYLRETDGKRCAMGAFLPDDHPALDPNVGMSAGTLIEEYHYGELFPNWAPLDFDGLEAMQASHDGAALSDDRSDDVTEEVVRWIEKNVEEASQ